MGDEAAKPSSGHDDTVPASATAGVAPQDAPPPEERYQLGAELGRGGMGRVVEAYDRHLGRTVAFKEVLATESPSIARRFQREVRITARLEHASIVPLYDSGLMADGRPFYVMRRVSGKPLDTLIERARGLEDRLALLPNMLAAIDAIAHAHRRAVIHRDLKPANILVGDLGETVVIDWGLAKVLDEAEPVPDSVEPRLPSDSLQTQAGAVFGTPGFMAPEQARGEDPTPRSDVFALGATLYQLLAGKPPVRGTSATEVIASTLRLRIPPLAAVSPGAPAELVTIIEKALTFEPTGRYRDAGELAEDVRRFLTGQLVAAHRYTRRQRLVRFAKRHRAALSIGALAMAAVAVLSWVSVHRIMTERDASTEARADAERQRGVATAQASEARRRADQLTVSHARTLLETSPVATIAVLQHVNDGQLTDEVGALARAAMMRGVPWGLPTLPELITSFEMTRDGKRLLELDRKGRLQILDLEQRISVLDREIAGAHQAAWVQDGRAIFLLRGKQPPAIFDPATNVLDHVDVAVQWFAKSTRGDVIAYAGDTGVGVIDVAKRAVTPLWTGQASTTIAIARDGSWIAYVDKRAKRWRVIDRSGRVLVDRPGDPSLFVTSEGGKLGVLMWGEIVETKPADAKPTFVPVALDKTEAQTVHSLVYHGETLTMFARSHMLSWNGTRVWRGASFDSGVHIGWPSAQGALVVAANDYNVHVMRDNLHLALPLTERPVGMYRVATSPESPRVAATAKDAILVWELAGLMPQILDRPPGTFIGAARVLLRSGPISDWEWRDLEANTHHRIVPKINGVDTGFEYDPTDGRVLVLVMTQTGRNALVIYPDLKKQVVVPDVGDKGVLALVPGDALIYSLGKGRVFGKVGDESSRELVTVQGEVVAVAANGPLGYAALSASGELVKGTFSGGGFARAQVADLGDGATIVCDTERNVLVATGNRLLRWRGDVHEVARFADKIDYVMATEVGVYVGLATRDLYFLAARGNQTPRRVPVSSASAIVDRGRRVVGLNAGMQVEIVEMPAFARWTLPRPFIGTPQLAVSPDGLRVLQGIGGRSALWTLPATVPPLARLTNAKEEDGELRWPWNP